MKHMSRFAGGLNVHFLVVMFCFFFPAVLFANVSDKTNSPFKISKKNEFHCAEVDKPVIGSPVSHEITVDPKRVERCDYKQIGSRLNDCEKLKIENSTVDQYGLVTLDTEKGPVRFSSQELQSKDGRKSRRVLVWTWPDTDMQYLCTAYSSKR